MKACVYNPNNQKEACLELVEIAAPTIAANSALVKIKGVGVCGSDLLKLDRALVQSGTVLVWTQSPPVYHRPEHRCCIKSPH